MTLRYLSVFADSWFADVSGSNYGAGAGKRLMSGRAVMGGSTWTNRFGIAFSDNLSNGDETINSVTLRWKGMGSETCIGNGSNPNCYIERVSNVTHRVAENGESANCTVTGAGAATFARYPGPTTTTTNRVQWNPASVAAGTIYEIDITDMFMDWWAVRSFRPAVPVDDETLCFNIVVKAVSESTDSQRFNIRSSEYSGGPIYDGGNGPDIVIDYTDILPPDQPVLTSPAANARQPLSTVAFKCTYSHPDGATINRTEFRLAGSNAVDGNGMLSTDVRIASATSSSWPVGGIVTVNVNLATTPSPALTRGNTYYWQMRTRDANLSDSIWSAVRAFPVNRLPTVTLVRPT